MEKVFFFFTNYTSDTGIISKICKELKKNRYENKSIENMIQIQTKNSQKRNFKKAEKHVKKCSTALVTGEMQMRTTFRLYFTPVRITTLDLSQKAKKPSNQNYKAIKQMTAHVCQEGIRETLLHFWQESKFVQPLQEPVWHLLRKIVTDLLQDPDIALFGGRGRIHIQRMLHPTTETLAQTYSLVLYS